MSLPAVSVLMPVHNAVATLRASVASVQAQTLGDWELWLIDDASTDGSGVLAAELAAGDPRIRVLSLPTNRGAAAARNAGLEQARGRYIAFLDADDLWQPDKLAAQLALFRDTGAALTFTGYSRADADGRLVERVRAAARVDYATLLKRNVLGCLTVIYDSAITGKVPMPDLRRQHDYALWLDIVRRFGPAAGLDRDMAIYRIGRASLSANKAGAARDIWRVYRDCQGLGLLPSLWFFGHYTWYGLRHRLIQRPRADAPRVQGWPG